MKIQSRMMKFTTCWKAYHMCFLVMVCVGLGPAPAGGTAELPSRAFDFLYKEGVKSYLENDWKNCILNLEEAVEDWHWWKDNTVRCRRTCSKESNEVELMSAALGEADWFYERVVHNTLCLMKCKQKVFGSRTDRVIESTVKDDFDLRKPYDYLQLCYYQVGQLKKAADAAFTVLAVQTNHTVMINNLDYYITEGSLISDDLVNLELKEYEKEYTLATLAYDKADYKGTIASMEKSLVAYYEAYEDCRSMCENPFDQGWHPDFISSIANHFTFTLRCKRRCSWQLSEFQGEIDDDFLSSYFNYLQFSYFQEGDIKKACEAVASYLTLSPEDEAQHRNKQFYLMQEGGSEDLFVPREDVVAFKKREDYEQKLIEYIETSFSFLLDEDDDDEGKIEHKEEVTEVKTESGTGNSSAVGEGLEISTVSISTENTEKVEL